MFSIAAACHSYCLQQSDCIILNFCVIILIVICRQYNYALTYFILYNIIFNIRLYNYEEVISLKDSICVFGDSIMKGVVLDGIRGKYILLKNSFINILGRSTGLTAVNYAKFGCTISKGRQIIESHAAELPVYKYVALEFGGNDCDFDWAAISRNPDALHKPKTPLDEFEDIYSDVIDKATASGSKPVLFSLPPLDASRYFAWISKGLDAENILRWLGDVEHIYRWHELYNNAVIKLSAAKRVPLIDIRRAFLETRDYPSLYCDDGIHPNEAGHALISRVVENFALAMA